MLTVTLVDYLYCWLNSDWFLSVKPSLGSCVVNVDLPMNPKISLMVGTKMTSTLTPLNKVTVMMVWRIQLNSFDAPNSWFTEVRIWNGRQKKEEISSFSDLYLGVSWVRATEMSILIKADPMAKLTGKRTTGTVSVTAVSTARRTISNTTSNSSNLEYVCKSSGSTISKNKTQKQVSVLDDYNEGKINGKK